MSENTNTVEHIPQAPVISDEQIIANSPFAQGFSVTRNGVTESLDILVGGRGNWKGVAYPAFQVKSEPVKAGQTELNAIVHDKTFLNGLVFYGKENIKKILNVFGRRIGQDLLENSIPESGENAGQLQLNALIAAWEKLQAASLKLSELAELRDAAGVAMNAALPKFIADMSNPHATPEDKAKIGAAFQELSSTYAQYKEEYDLRKTAHSKEKGANEFAGEGAEVK